MLLLCIYYHEPLGKACVWTGQKISVAAVSVRNYVVTTHEANKAKRLARKLEKERLKELASVSVLPNTGDSAIPSSDALSKDELIENRVFSSEELSLIKEQNLTVFTSQNGSRYVTITLLAHSDSSPDIWYLRIPEEENGVKFNPCDDYVFSSEVAGLYLDPTFEGGAAFKTTVHEAFKRVGISADCCYQLVTESGQIYYSDGTHYKRSIDVDNPSCNITLPNERVEIELEPILQMPELPTGCEVTSLATVLQYMGFDVSKTTLADNYLPKAKVGSANFYNEFVGNPRDDLSFGCYAPVIEKAANAYLATMGSNLSARDLTGTDFEELLTYIRNGSPVIVWGSTDINLEPAYPQRWIVNGEYLEWKSSLHCMVLTGYDGTSQTVIVSDPLRGITEYDVNLFAKRYIQFYSQAIIIN